MPTSNLANSDHFINNIEDLAVFNLQTAMVLTTSEPVEIPTTTPDLAFAEFTKKYPAIERWRLFVDGRQYALEGPSSFWPIRNELLYDLSKRNYPNEDPLQLGFKHQNKLAGWLTYEKKEPGSLSHALYAFNYALQLLNKPRDPISFSQNINNRLFDTSANHYKRNRKVKKACGTKFGLPNYLCASEAGVKDLLEKIANNGIEGAYLKLSRSAINKLILNVEVSSEKEKVYNDIINLACKNPNALFKDYILDHQFFENLKRRYPQYYETFLMDISAQLTHSEYQKNKDDYVYYSFSGKQFDQINKLYHFVQNTIVHEKNLLMPSLNIAKEFSKKFPDQMRRLQGIVTAHLYQDNVQPLESAYIEELRAFLVSNYAQLIHDKSLQTLKNHSYTEFFETATQKCDAENNVNMADTNEALLNIMLEYTLNSTMNELIRKVAIKSINQKLEQQKKNIWQAYYQNISKPQLTSDEKIAIIGEAIQAFERTHPYGDGNGRTFVNIVLNILLLENGFPPATFMNPNMFDVHHDIVNVIKRGILNTLEIYKAYDENKEPTLFGFKTLTLEQYIQDALNKLKELQQTDSSIEIEEAISGLKKLRMRSIVEEAEKYLVKERTPVSIFSPPTPPTVELERKIDSPQFGI